MLSLLAVQGARVWPYLDSDRAFFERELASFIPPRLFDAHAHLYDCAHFGSAPPELVRQGPATVGAGVYQTFMEQMLPRRQVSGLFFGWPEAGTDLAAMNDFVGREVGRERAWRAEMLVRPEMDVESMRESVRRHHFVGLKCYHVYASERPTFQAAIPSYLPEAQVRLAHEEGLAVPLHMVRSRALADASNQEAIRRYAERYPHARLILAHAARGFNPSHTVAGIGALRGLKNVWFDTSAVTECGAVEAIARTMGVERLLYGSDFPVCYQRGRCVAIGDSFLWLGEDNTNFGADYSRVQPTLVGYESLRALKLSCLNLGLSDTDVERIFYGNAVELFGRTH